SLVLGGGEVKLLEHVGAFSVFANDGVRAPVHGINKIIDSTGKEIGGPPKEKRIMNAEIARKINNILSDNKARTYVFGPNAPVYVPGKTVAAKTGTTQDHRDALTIGYTPDLAVGVWVGNNDSTLMRPGSIGSKVAAPLWNAFISRELENLPDTQFKPYTVVKSSNPMVTGNKPGEINTSSGEIYFHKGTGKQITEEKARKMDGDKLEKRYTRTYGGYSILHYVNKDTPLDESAQPNLKDPMMRLWDASVSGGGVKKTEEKKEDD
ncbi:MAG: penicillin-binding transpeptidase domain-containing protein, partial [Patescibacteria group bacterium]